ncbi:MAG: ROK family protein, partial [Chitinophagia bacterium]|nr:ROK family protein [Chitinophagia bacterium]
MSANEPLAIGIDLGGTGTKFGIVDRVGNVLFSSEMSTKKHKTVESFIDELYLHLNELIDKAGGIGRMRGIGMGAPNGNFYSGTIEYAPNLPWRGIIPIAKMMSDKFKLDVTLTNDANAAAIGEMMYGAAKGMKDFIMITLGTGVGSGFVANGQLIYGHDGFAGEIGHTIVIPDGRIHEGTGKKGSLESYASATGVRLTALEVLENNNEPSLLRSLNKEEIDSKAVYDAAIKGDKLALEIFEYTGRILGISLANAVMIS